MGARLEEYKKVAPDFSFIHVEEFSGPEELAKYLAVTYTKEELEALSLSISVVRGSWKEWQRLASISGWMFEQGEMGIASSAQSSSSVIGQMSASLSQDMEN